MGRSSAVASVVLALYVVVVGSIIPKPSLFRFQFAISAHYQATKEVCKPLATSDFPETRCFFSSIAQPSARFVAHSAFISHSVTSEAFAMKPKPRLFSAHPKPRLCPRLICPISPICPNPETRSLASASPKPRLSCAIVRPPLSSSALYGLLLLYRLLGLYLLLATSKAFAP